MSTPLPAAPVLPLPGDKPVLLARLVEGLDAGGLWWLSGYAAALAGRRAERPEATDTAPASGRSALLQKTPLTIV
jgi:sulfite reductase (NADPH) flavoprotein alpha-component